MVKDIHSRLILLPSELKHHIAKFSSYDSLASLARTHTALQREAEQALYRTLSDPSMNCIETLAANSEKAGFVQILTMGLVSLENDSDDPWRTIDYLLLNALANMHSLFDFRMRMPRFKGSIPRTENQQKIYWGRMPPHEHQPRSESLEKILCNGHFRLQTLFCDNSLDLSRIIRSQTDLQILGLYEHSMEPEFWRIFKQLQTDQLRLPLVVTLDYSYYPYLNMISIYPAFYSIDRRPTILQFLAEHFEEDQRFHALSFEGSIDKLAIYLVDFCDMPSLHELTKNIATILQVTSLDFCVENPCEIPFHEIKKIISLFPCLNELMFYINAGHDRRTIPEDIKRAYVKDWELVCPNLEVVKFTDSSGFYKQGPEKEWFLYFS